MELFAEMKLMQDGYAGGFSCGLTMHDSQTMQRFQEVEATKEGRCYLSEDGLQLEMGQSGAGEAIRVWSVFTNHSQQTVTLEMITSFGIRGVKADRVHRLQSFWSAEGKLRTETVEELHLEPSWNRCGLRMEKFGNTGSMPVRKYFPFVALQDGEDGEITAIQLYCPSTWQMEILCREDDTLTLIGGLGDRDFGHWYKEIGPGEQFRTPDAVIATGKSLCEVCDKLVKAQRPLISEKDQNMDILFNEYCTTWGNPTFDNVRRICDKLEGKGIRFLVIDSGWYGNAENWWDQVGDWDVNENRFPGGMKPIADYIRSRGMIPGLWYEMESVTSGSKYYNCPEHLVRKDGIPLTVGNRRFWDMEDPWVIDYLSRKVIGLLKEAGFGYLKVDYNDSMGMGCDGCESLGEGLRRKVLASQAFFRKIREEIPGIVIENCSSGGHRLEPSMMSLCSQASFSDAHEIPSIPLIAANMHRVIRPDQSQIWAVLRAEDTRDRIHYSLLATMLGRMCLSGDIYHLSDRQWELVDEGIAFYRQCAEIIQNGVTVLHRCTPTSYNRPKGQQLVIRKWGNRHLAILHRFEDSRYEEPQFPESCRILAQYGDGQQDFSAKAWIYEA